MNEVEEGKEDKSTPDKEDDAEINEDDFNWSNKLRPARNPGQPTTKEREEHEALQMPYRGWCAHCVRGRGVSSHHTMSKEGQR